MNKDLKDLLIINFKQSIIDINNIFHFGNSGSEFFVLSPITNFPFYENLNHNLKFSIYQDVDGIYVSVDTCFANGQNPTYSRFQLKKEITRNEYNDLIKFFNEKTNEYIIEFLNRKK